MDKRRCRLINPSFKVTVFFEGEYLTNSMSQGQSFFYRTLTGSNNQSVEWCQFR